MTISSGVSGLSASTLLTRISPLQRDMHDSCTNSDCLRLPVHRRAKPHGTSCLAMLSACAALRRHYSRAAGPLHARHSPQFASAAERGWLGPLQRPDMSQQSRVLPAQVAQNVVSISSVPLSASCRSSRTINRGCTPAAFVRNAGDPCSRRIFPLPVFGRAQLYLQAVLTSNDPRHIAAPVPIPSAYPSPRTRELRAQGLDKCEVWQRHEPSS